MKLFPFEMREYSKIDLENTINSGQVFLWQKLKNNWYGIDGQNILRINKSCKIKTYSKQKTDFFRKNDDIKRIIQSICKDKTTINIASYFEFKSLVTAIPCCHCHKCWRADNGLSLGLTAVVNFCKMYRRLFYFLAGMTVHC